CERIVGADLVRIGEGRPGPMLERQTVEHERDADAADEWGVVLADEDHGEPPQSATLAAGGTPVKRRGTSSDCATAGADGTVGRQEGSQGRGEAHMTRAGDERQDAQV